MADKLPIELKNKIINYTNVVTFFKGKYYNKISLNDERYEMLKKVIKLSTDVSYNYDYNHDILVRTLKKDIGESYNTPRYCIIYHMYKNCVGDIIRHELIFSPFKYQAHSDRYIFTKENKWAKIIEYDM